MTDTEFAELCEMIDARFPPSDIWANAHRFAADFKDIDAVEVFAAYDDFVMHAKPDDLRFAPTPEWLRRRAIERTRRNADPTYQQAQLPATTGDFENWREKHHPGKSWREIVREQHAGMLAEKCLSPHCEIHREHPEPWPEGWVRAF